MEGCPRAYGWYRLAATAASRYREEGEEPAVEEGGRRWGGSEGEEEGSWRWGGSDRDGDDEGGVGEEVLGGEACCW